MSGRGSAAQRERRIRARHERAYRERNYVALSSYALVQRNVDVPDDIERRDSHAPCFMCGTAHGACRHRPAGVPEPTRSLTGCAAGMVAEG